MKIKSIIIATPVVTYIGITLLFLTLNLISTKSNPADSGESAIMYVLLTILPWVQLFDIKFSHVGIYPISMLLALANACLILLATTLIVNIFHYPIRLIKKNKPNKINQTPPAP